MSDSVWPHRRQPTRVCHPWDSPGMNTGVGCHFLLQCMKVKSESEVAQSCPTLSDPMDCMQPTRLLRPWDFPGKSTGVGCHCLLCNFSLVARFIYHLPFYSFFSEYSSSMSRGFLKIHTQNFKPCILTHSDQVKKAHCFHGSGHHLSTDVALHNHYLLHATSYCYFIWA